MYKVYWTDEHNKPCCDEFIIMTEALSLVESLRTKGYRFVTMVSENSNLIGRPGVDEIINGKLPDGNIYEWKKRRK